MTNAIDEERPQHHRDDGGLMPLPDRMSMWIACLTILGLIVWVVVTHYRVSVPVPTYWLTAAAPVWAALIVLGLQMVFLVASAVHATRREEMGIADMLVSITTFSARTRSTGSVPSSGRTASKCSRRSAFGWSPIGAPAASSAAADVRVR